MTRWNAGRVVRWAIAISTPACATDPDDGDADTTSAQSTLPGTTVPGTTDPTPVSDSASSGATEACEQEMYVEQHCFEPSGVTTTLGPDEWGSSTSGEETTGGDASVCDGLDPPIPDDCAKVIVNTGPAYVTAGLCCYDVEYMRGCCG
jgi:hypothetical protein